jgi:hypothetical protein
MHLPSSKTTLIQIIGRALRLHFTKNIANIILPFSSNDDEKSICNFLKIMAQNDSRIKKSFQNKKLGGYINIENTNEDEEEEENDLIEFKYNMIYNSLGIKQNSIEIWMKRLDDVKKYIDMNNKKPSKIDKDNNVKSLGCWIFTQKINYKNKEYIMKNEEIYNKWNEFINDMLYLKYLMSNEDIWYKTLNNVKEYINTYHKRPSNIDKDKNIKSLGCWIFTQKINYKNKEKIMKNEEIYNKWNEFINDPMYLKYFMSNEDIWYETLNNVKKYINTYHKKPSSIDKDNNVKSLGYWISDQQKNYKNKEKIMKNEKIYNKWNEFINNQLYIKYFNK